MRASPQPAVAGQAGGTTASRPVRTSAAADGSWPRTGRLLPWLVAGYVLLLVLVPFDSTQLPIGAPIDTTLDRLAIGGLVLALVLLAGSSVSGARPALRPLGLVGASFVLFLVVAFTSDLINLTRLEYAGELGLAVRRFVYLLGYAVSFAVIAWAVRYEDVPALVRLTIGAGLVCALGLIVQQRLGINAFFDWTRSAFGGALTIDPTPVKKYSYSRAVVTGPTQHGLAAACMLLMIAPFALVEAIRARDLRTKVVFGGAFVLLVLGASATLRRTSVLALLGLLVALTVYRHRHMLRLVPFVIPAYLVGQVVAPGVGGNLVGQLLGRNANSEASTEGRTSDYAAIVPDVLNRPFLGRGFGTYTPESYRVLDNQYLLFLLEIGVLGLVAFGLVLLAMLRQAHVVQRSRDDWEAWFGVAALAAIVVFAISCALFDVLSFPQPVYMLTFVAGLLVVISAGRGGEGPAKPVWEAPQATTAG